MLKIHNCVHSNLRPVQSRHTSQSEVNQFLIGLQNLNYESNWEAVPIHYEDYELTDQRKIILNSQIQDFISNLLSELDNYKTDALSNESCCHITGRDNSTLVRDVVTYTKFRHTKSVLYVFATYPANYCKVISVKGTESQASSDLWHNIRRFRVTASEFKAFSSCTNNAIRNMWEGKVDIADLAQVKWGKENEEKAVQKYNSTYTDPIISCGIFVSKQIPFIAASPDGIDVKNKLVVEIKCPYSRRDSDPNINIPDFCYKDDDLIKIRKSHPYYCQIMCQMFCLGYKKGRFVI